MHLTSNFMCEESPASHLMPQLHMGEAGIIQVLLPAAALTQTFPNGRVIGPQKGVGVQLIAKSAGYRSLPLHHHSSLVTLTCTGAADSREIRLESSVTWPLCLEVQAGRAYRTPEIWVTEEMLHLH